MWYASQECGDNQVQGLAKASVPSQQFGPHLVCHFIKSDKFLVMVHCTMPNLWCNMGGFAFVDDVDLCVSGSGTATQTVKQIKT